MDNSRLSGLAFGLSLLGTGACGFPDARTETQNAAVILQEQLEVRCGVQVVNSGHLESGADTIMARSRFTVTGDSTAVHCIEDVLTPVESGPCVTTATVPGWGVENSSEITVKLKTDCHGG